MMRDSSVGVVPEQRWEGGSGFKSFNPDGRLAVPDPPRFRSTWRKVAVEGVHAAEWTTSPIAGALPVSRDYRAIALLAVDHGVMRLWTGGGVLEMRGGSIHLLSGGRPIRFSITEQARVLRIVIPTSYLPPDKRGADDFRMSSVEATRLTAGLLSIVEQVLDETAGGSTCPAARALRPLAVAAVEDALPDSDEDDLRTRILTFIDRRLHDPELGPQMIADEFKISLRWTHHVFNIDGSSLARYIRDRRVDQVADRLRTGLLLPRIAVLADRAGFAHRDQMTRAFRARYGVTVGDYATLAAQHIAPEPLTPREA